MGAAEPRLDQEHPQPRHLRPYLLGPPSGTAASSSSTRFGQRPELLGELVRPLLHQLVAGVGEHPEGGVGQQLGDGPRRPDRREDVARAGEDERRLGDRAEGLADVVVEQPDARAAQGLVVHRLDARPHLLDRRRRRALAEREPAHHERQVVARGPPRERVAPVEPVDEAGAERRRPAQQEGVHRGGRRGGDEPEAAHPLLEHVGMVRAEAHERHPAHRVADHDRAAEVELLEHGREVPSEHA